MIPLYILDDERRIIRCNDLVEWGLWMETGDRVVAQTDIDGVWVSTVFLGMDHNFLELGDPKLFETMVFHDGEGGQMQRYFIWPEAEKGHAEIVREIELASKRADSAVSEILALMMLSHKSV